MISERPITCCVVEFRQRLYARARVYSVHALPVLAGPRYTYEASRRSRVVPWTSREA